jgi:hypothetical protein
MSTFTPGQVLSCRSSADYDCIFRFEVLTRTEHFVTLHDGHDKKRVKIKTYQGREYCQPYGNYSMAPVIYADQVLS